MIVDLPMSRLGVEGGCLSCDKLMRRSTKASTLYFSDARLNRDHELSDYWG